MHSRTYRLVLTVEGLVHIGDGRKYGKKDYFFESGKIAILDASAFVAQLDSRQLDSYCQFLKEDSRRGLQIYLDTHKNLSSVAQKAVRYQLNSPLAQARGGTSQYFDIASFVKDAYGCPYIPGSSIKGMLRTAILINLVARDRQTYERLYDRDRVLKKPKGADTGIQQEALWTGQLDKSRLSAANDVLRYLSVADSDPLSVSDLVVAKKYDKFSKGDDAGHKKRLGRISDDAYYQGNELPIYRECLRPGVVIRTTITIDERIDQYLKDLRLDRDGLREAIGFSYELYQRCFLSHFDTDDDVVSSEKGVPSDGRCGYVLQSGPFAGTRCRNRAANDTGYCNTHKQYAETGGRSGDSSVQKAVCYLGGGADFNTKTIQNALFADEARRVDEISHILYEQFSTRLDARHHASLEAKVRRAGFEPRLMLSQYKKTKMAKDDHRHWRDGELGVSPHTRKMGKVGKQLYPMGKCRVEIEELI